ncbi:3692_t:CDS:2 [Entrophospora sp. SA101]|nr:3692_t:CDS:2 [Entrophospora sp. SA101]
MGNSSSTIIFQNFGNVNNIEPVCEAINIPGVKEFPKDSLEAQLYWIDQAALRFLTMNWTLHYKYPWNNNETVPDGATSHGAIQGTKWVDQNFGVAEVSDYLQVKYYLVTKITEGFKQAELIDLSNSLGKIILELLNGPEQSFRDQATTFPIGDTRIGFLNMHEKLLEHVEYGELEEEIPKISTFANWITRTYAGWKKQMAEETLGASSLYI